MTPDESIAAWFRNDFNQAILSAWAKCPDCDAAPQTPCTDEPHIRGSWAHASRADAGREAMRRYLNGEPIKDR